MRLASLQIVALFALSALAGAARADPPSRVGRVAATEGQVTLYAGADPQANPALLNWPVTGANRIVTAPGASAEIRIGASAIRLDGDSELEVVDLDDNQLHLFLNYGTVAARIGADTLAGFELSTTRARATLRQPGQLRVDTERAPGLTVVGVLAGVAQVDGGGASLTVEAGNRADIGDAGVRTGQLARDAFDNWPAPQNAAAPALRYLSADTTGYEELDRYGSWSEDGDYGPVWQPRALPSGWAPYSDGRWTWVEPWGWTWVDNAPWGYAPSHYGRWVLLGQRWSWSPGVVRTRQAWAPALVGWVGGGQWQARFADRGAAPAVGWYPLPPRARYVPGYRVSPEYQRRLNADHDGRWGERPGRPRRPEREDGRPDGLTLVPHDQFGSGRTVAVFAAPRAIMGVSEIHNLPPAGAPPFGPTRRGTEAGGQDANAGRWRQRDDVRGQHADSGPRGGASVSTAPPVFGQPVRADVAPAPRPPATPPAPPAPSAPSTSAAPATVVLGAPGSSGRTVWGDHAPQRPPVNSAPEGGPPPHPRPNDVPDRARMRLNTDGGNHASPVQHAPQTPANMPAPPPPPPPQQQQQPAPQHAAPPVHQAPPPQPAPQHPAPPAHQAPPPQPAPQHAAPPAHQAPPPQPAPQHAVPPAHQAVPETASQRAGEADQGQRPERNDAGRERGEPRKGGPDGRREMTR